MGKVAQMAEERELAPATPQNQFRELLRKNWDKISAVMPRHMTSERMFQMCVSAFNAEPKLAECSAASVLSCIMKCAALGLEPSNMDGLGRAYILPFWNKKTRGMEATFILGYKGILDLARNSGGVRDISARAVHEGDSFEYRYGLDEVLQHVPADVPGARLTHVYCLANFVNGGHYFCVLTREQVDEARAASKAGDYGPWVTHYDAMAMKTAVRRAFPYLPVSVAAQDAAASDEQTPDYSAVLAPVVAAEPEPEPEPIDVPEPEGAVPEGPDAG